MSKLKEADCHEHVPLERAELFEAHDGGSTEVEYLELLTALVRVEKPQTILETGTLKGWSTHALEKGCDNNGFGHVYSIDVHQSNVWWSDIVTFVQSDTLEWLQTIDLKFDMAFFDSDLSIRCQECRACIERGLLKEGALVVFHDTSRWRIKDGKADPAVQTFWAEFFDLECSQFFEFPLSRGLTIARVRRRI